MRPIQAALAAALAAGCHVVDAKAWNLKELHDDTGHHRYSGALESDMEFFFRHQVAPSFAVGGARFEDKTAIAIPDPATACLENLIGLEAFGDRDPHIAAMQVEWFARLAVSDPARLSRERAVHGLARAGARLSAGIPTALAKDQTPAGPEAVGEALAGLVRASRPVLERGLRATAAQRLDLDAACQVIEGMTLDVDGARRTLRAAADLSAAAGAGNLAAAPLSRLSEELQRRCVRQALAAALFDPEPLVRAAAVEAAVKSAGSRVLNEILVQLPHEMSPEVLVRVMDVVRHVGLPDVAPADSNATPEQWREIRLTLIYDLLDRPESAVRVGAMRALARVSDAGIASLREEDWQSWWLSRREKRGP